MSRDDTVFNPEAADEADPRLLSLINEEVMAVGRDLAAQAAVAGTPDGPGALDGFALGVAGRILGRPRSGVFDHCRVAIAVVVDAQRMVGLVPAIIREGEESAGLHALEDLARRVGDPQATILVSTILRTGRYGGAENWAAVQILSPAGGRFARFAPWKRGEGVVGPWTDDGPGGGAGTAAAVDPESLN